MMTNDRNLAEAVRRIVEVSEPERILLFGSAARRETTPNSDFDLLVIKRGAFDRNDLLKRIYVRLYGVGSPVDVVLVTPEDVERYRDTPGLVIKPAIRDGVEVYRA